jgi:Na+/proline symporter
MVIWGWIMMSLGSGISTALMLKFYWWRYNGEGFAIGTLVGMIIAILQRFLFPDMVEWQQFLLVFSLTFLSIIVSTLLTPPPDEEVVRRFYENTRPFGFWKPYKKYLPEEVRMKMKREHKYDLISLPFILLAQVTLYLMPMQLIIHTFHTFRITLALFLVGVAGIYWFWYRNLAPAPGKNEG